MLARTFALALCMWAGISVLAAGDGALLPPDGFAQGWAREGAQKIYEGEALYDHIDGGGEVFLELGFEACTVQRYRKGQEGFALEVYRMTDTAAALGIYLMQCGKETPDKAFAERHTVGKNQLLLVKGRFYLVATSPEPWPDVPGTLVAAARAATAGLLPTEPPEVLALLPEDGLVPGSLRILRGPVGLQALVTLGDGDVLLLDRKATALAGDYKAPNGEIRTVIVAEYPSVQAAKEALRHLIQKLDSTLTLVSASDAGLLFKDHKNRYGKASVSGTTLTIRLGLAAKPE